MQEKRSLILLQTFSKQISALIDGITAARFHFVVNY